MTEVVQSKTVEINDAVFCLAHFKEKVRPVRTTSHPFLSAPSPSLPHASPILTPFSSCLDSARTAMLTCGRRTTGSSGYVLSWLISGAAGGGSAPRWSTHAFFLFLLSRSLTLSNAMASRRPRRARTRTTCISARSTALPVRYRFLVPSPPSRVFVFSFISFPRDPKMILMFYLFRFRM